MQFSKLGLAEPLLRVTETLGYETTTPIQQAAIPVVLSGADLIGCAQTGTGKTAAFTLPMLQRLLQPAGGRDRPEPGTGKTRRGRRPPGRTPRALVLSPTRELAVQIDESFRRYGRFTRLRSAVIYGGVKQGPQVHAVERGVDALIATPGRLLDLLNQGHIDLSRIELLVFDEADQMLDMGFVPDLKRIVARVPSERQTLMFSATMPDSIRQLTKQWLRSPESIDLTPAKAPPKRIAQSVHLVDRGRKHDLLTHYLRGTERSRTVVFSRTKHGADKIVKRLIKEGVDAAAIHGNKSQNARNRALTRFKGARPPVLVATDIAARGLDIRDVSHVVNFDLPDAPETYVHRIGRTGRAGASGVAVSFCSAAESTLLHEIERLTQDRIAVEPTVEGFEPTEKSAAKPKPASKKPARRHRRSKAGASNPSSRPGARAFKGGQKKRSRRKHRVAI
ncbi:MAG: DEAD/DEAH box helicase [Planctomycetota bacterium]